MSDLHKNKHKMSKKQLHDKRRMIISEINKELDARETGRIDADIKEYLQENSPWTSHLLYDLANGEEEKATEQPEDDEDSKLSARNVKKFKKVVHRGIHRNMYADHQNSQVVQSTINEYSPENVMQSMYETNIYKNIYDGVQNSLFSRQANEDHSDDPFARLGQNHILSTNPVNMNTDDQNSSFSYFLFIVFMIVGTVYLVLRQAIKRHASLQEQELEKYEFGGDGLLTGNNDGNNDKGVTNKMRKYLKKAQRISEKVARGMLSQNSDSTPGNNFNFNPSNEGPHGFDEQNDGQIISSKPLESLVSGTNSNDSKHNTNQGMPFIQKKSVSDKKKELTSNFKQIKKLQDDDEFEQA